VWCVPLLVAVASAARGGPAGKALGVAVTWLIFVAPTYYWFAPAVLQRQPWPSVRPERFGELVVYSRIALLVVLALWLSPRWQDRGAFVGRPEIPRPRRGSSQQPFIATGQG